MRGQSLRLVDKKAHSMGFLSIGKVIKKYKAIGLGDKSMSSMDNPQVSWTGCFEKIPLISGIFLDESLIVSSLFRTRD
ncbi:hypothetical protein [Photobacterium lutimaris]|uniref:hypothetical protein n=1 Tax=Photobacterium lutimaris TaxID=388278 RepID=UPI00105D2FB0|nr:hypothetical protein [Photobacterium lutimaris]